MPPFRNPASLRVKERPPSTLDLSSIVGLIFPNGTVFDLGRGFLFIDTRAAVLSFEPTQDGVNPRLFTIPGTDSWTASSIRVFLNGQLLRTSLLSVGGPGNRTILLDATMPAPDLIGSPPDIAPDVVEAWGVKA